ncbi:hypothetical protein HN587_02805 [Candidatus Woesearchaeota archaeon]|jgi:hypothetical protein|nr:hypothetical protein [Candidatus Woesearchaeota archaeon]
MKSIDISATKKGLDKILFEISEELDLRIELEAQQIVERATTSDISKLIESYARKINAEKQLVYLRNPYKTRKQEKTNEPDSAFGVGVISSSSATLGSGLFIWHVTQLLSYAITGGLGIGLAIAGIAPTIYLNHRKKTRERIQQRQDWMESTNNVYNLHKLQVEQQAYRLMTQFEQKYVNDGTNELAA